MNVALLPASAIALPMREPSRAWMTTVELMLPTEANRPHSDVSMTTLDV